MRAPSLVLSAVLLAAGAPPCARAEALAGRVVDASGAPVPYAAVTLWPAAAEHDADAPALAELSADAGGAFRADVAGTPRFASARAAGFAGPAVVVRPPEGVLVRLERATPLEGRLVEERGGRPIAGVRVRARARGADSLGLAAGVPYATSDEHGAFRFDLAPDEYALAVAQDGWDGALERVRVGLAGVPAPHVELRARAGVPLGGVVADADGSAVAGARVAIVANDVRTYDAYVNGMVMTAPRGVTVTDATGRFRVPALNPAASYTVVVARNGFERAEITTPSSSGRVAPLAIRLARAAALHARLVRPDGTPYDGPADATCAEDPEFPETAPPARTVRVVEGDVPADAVALPCTLTLAVDGFRPVQVGALRSAAEGAIEAGEFRLDRGLAIAGSVVDRAGIPVAGATVNAGGRTATSGADGTFEAGGFDPLPAEDPASAEVEVTAEREGWVLVAPVGGVRPGQRDVVVRLARAVAVVGRVVSGDPPAPLRGAQVEVFRAGRARLRRATYRDPSGRFRVGDLEADRYTLRIAVPGYLPVRLERLDLTRRESTDLGDVRLVRGVPLRGLVIDARSGAPVAQATVRVDPRANATNERPFEEHLAGETGGDGRFAFDGLEPGRHVLEVRAAGRASARLDVDAGVALPEVVVRLGARGAIAGTVRDATGAPCEACRVIVQADEDEGEAASAETDALGRYLLTGVQPGPQTVIVTGPAAGDENAFERDMPPERLVSRRVDVTADATARLDVPGSAGVVRAHGTLRWKGRPLAARMTWLAPGASRSAPQVALDASRADGTFDVVVGGPGEYRLIVAFDSDDPEVGSLNANLLVAVPPGRDAALDLEVPAGAITGRVVTDRAGDPVAGAVVMVRRTGTGDDFPDGFGVAGEDGTFSVGPLQDGRYELTVRAPPYAIARRDRPVTVRSGETASAGTLRVKDGTALRVRVVDEQDQPVEEAEVASAAAGALEMGARTDVDGFATLENLPDGPLDVAAMADGYAPGFAFGVTAAGGDADPPRIRIARGVALTVRASDAAGAPLEGLLVHVAPKGRREIGALLQERRVSSMLTNAAGRVEIPRLAPGDYDVWIALGDLAARRTVTIGSGKAKELALVLR